MKHEVALALVLCSMNDFEVFTAWRIALKSEDPRAKQIGEELLRRLHAADPSFPLPKKEPGA